MSAWENVAIPRLLAGARLRQAKPRAIELLNLVGMGSRVAHRPKELSGGEMQRVAIARALMMNPRIILADEPTGNLDTKTGCAIIDLLQSVAYEPGDSSNALLVVIVTHDLSLAEGADRIISIRDGHVLHDRPGAVLGPNHFRHQDGGAGDTYSDISTPGTTPTTSNKVSAWSRQHSPHEQFE
jgi:putative ABC transport system ATP-binding protein